MMQRRYTTVVVLLALTACSTVATRREDPPTLVRQTSKTVAEFRGCLLPQFDKSTYPVIYAPTANGETYSQGASQGIAGRYVNWVVDVADLGSTREVRLHAIDSMWGPNKGLIRQVEACL